MKTLKVNYFFFNVQGPIWELWALFACNVSAQNLPRFSRIHRSNGKSGTVKMGYGKSVG